MSYDHSNVINSAQLVRLLGPAPRGAPPKLPERRRSAALTLAAELGFKRTSQVSAAVDAIVQAVVTQLGEAE